MIAIYPTSRIEEIAQAIKESSNSLSELDQSVLIAEYGRIGVPVDQLVLQPQHLSQLTSEFRKRTKRNVAAEELVRTLLRLRKSGKLPSPAGEKKRSKPV